MEYTRKLAFDTDRLAEFTFWLVAATGVMAAIVFGQLLMFRSQLKIMRDGVGDAKTVADAAKAGAELSRDEFFATHRPRMVIRRLSFEVSGGYPVELNYTVHNVGDAAGTIVARSGSLWLPNENESLATAPAEEAAIENIPVDSGDSQPVTHEIDDCQADLNFNYGLGPRPRILFVGYLKYTDRAGVVRETRFLREYSHDTKLFTAIDHPDYEYQD